MRIMEQLHFSVLAAPVAAIDRRALSQAWYSALYGSASPRARGAARACFAAPARQGAAGAHSQQAPARAAEALCARPPEAPRPPRALGLPVERRAPRSPLARKIERVFLRPRSPANKSAFTFESEHGRVHVLLRSSGPQLKLVAISRPRARAQVAEALAQARYALAARGIVLDAQMREEASC